MEKEDVNLKPVITEKRLWNLKNVFLAILIGVAIVIFFIFLLLVFNLDLMFSVLIGCFFIVIYAIMLFFLLEPGILREVKHVKLRTFREENEIPVITQIPYEVEKRIYYSPEKPTKSLPMPITKKQTSYKYIGSMKSGTYHKKECRLGRSIKKQNIVRKDKPDYFKKHQYRPCKVCILKTKKV